MTVETKHVEHWEVRVDGEDVGVVYANPTKGYFFLPEGSSMSMMMPKYFPTLEECAKSAEDS